MNKVITRFAPSPTGNLHSGVCRTAIFSYLYARKHGGSFVLRIEDTDRERSKKEYEENILESLAWLDLEYDVLVRQSDNLPRHKAVLEKLIADGHAYISKEEAKDGSGVIKEIVRFKNPNIDITFTDEIKGEVTMNTEDLGDFVIAKNINEPLFHLAVVVDDFDEGITHVIRGEDHVSNTPRQILIQRAIGAPTPVYAHLPLVLGIDKQKLSKRKGALALTEYRDFGYLPEAILNMVAMVGWNPGTEQELFSKEELVRAFDLVQVQHSPAVFNPEKLDWYNKEYIKKLSADEQLRMLRAFMPESVTTRASYSPKLFERIAPIVLERIAKFSDLRTMAEAGELAYFFERPTVAPEKLLWKTNTAETTKTHLGKALELISGLPEGILTPEQAKEALWGYAEEAGRGDVLWPVRVALSGQEKSPDPFAIIAILGKKEALARIEAAHESL